MSNEERRMFYQAIKTLEELTKAVKALTAEIKPKIEINPSLGLQ